MVEVAGDGAILSEGVDASLASALARRGDEAMSHAEMRAITEAPPSPSRTQP